MEIFLYDDFGNEYDKFIGQIKFCEIVLVFSNRSSTKIMAMQICLF